MADIALDHRYPCPEHADGAHRLADRGRQESLYGNVFRCQCGAWNLDNTDEWRAAWAAYCDLRAERADEDRLTAAAGAAARAVLAGNAIRRPA